MKRFLIACALSALCAVPSQAGSFGFFGSYWDTQDLSHAVGGGIRTSFGEQWQFDLRGTYYNDLTNNSGPNHFKVHSAPLDAGVSYHFMNNGNVEPYLGAGASYFLMSASRGDLSDEVGYYGLGGLEIGRGEGSPRLFVEASYREVSGTVRFNNSESPPDVSVTDRFKLQLRGISGNVGLIWRW
jgi:hypothetical protein